MKIYIRDSRGISVHECSSYRFAGNVLTLYEKVEHGNDKVARPDEERLLGAYWGIEGFEIEYEEAE